MQELSYVVRHARRLRGLSAASTALYMCKEPLLSSRDLGYGDVGVRLAIPAWRDADGAAAFWRPTWTTKTAQRPQSG